MKRNYITLFIIFNSMKGSNTNWVGIGLISGAGIGTTLGVLYNNIAVFTAFGAGIGIVIGAIAASYKSKK